MLRHAVLQVFDERCERHFSLFVCRSAFESFYQLPSEVALLALLIFIGARANSRRVQSRKGSHLTIAHVEVEAARVGRRERIIRVGATYRVVTARVQDEQDLAYASLLNLILNLFDVDGRLLQKVNVVADLSIGRKQKSLTAALYAMTRKR